MRRQWHNGIVAVACLLFLAACSEDERYFPPITKDLAVAYINAQGIIATLTFDNGTSYNVAAQGIDTNAQLADTAVRCQTSYVLDDGSCTIYGIYPIFAEKPVTHIPDWAAGEQYDPFKVESAWVSGGYLNVRVAVESHNKAAHAFAFVQDSQGHYTLLHRHYENDQAKYTVRDILSMPLPPDVEHPTLTAYTNEGVYVKTF